MLCIIANFFVPLYNTPQPEAKGEENKPYGGPYSPNATLKRKEKYIGDKPNPYYQSIAQFDLVGPGPGQHKVQGNTKRLMVLVPGKKYSKIRTASLYGRSDTHGFFTIYFANPCLIPVFEYFLPVTSMAR